MIIKFAGLMILVGVLMMFGSVGTLEIDPTASFFKYTLLAFLGTLFCYIGVYILCSYDKENKHDD